MPETKAELNARKAADNRRLRAKQKQAVKIAGYEKMADLVNAIIDGSVVVVPAYTFPTYTGEVNTVNV